MPVPFLTFSLQNFGTRISALNCISATLQKPRTCSREQDLKFSFSNELSRSVFSPPLWSHICKIRPNPEISEVNQSEVWRRHHRRFFPPPASSLALFFSLKDKPVSAAARLQPKEVNLLYPLAPSSSTRFAGSTTNWALNTNWISHFSQMQTEFYLVWQESKLPVAIVHNRI